MKIVFSWDDGALEDQILFDLHDKYEIPGMFFVPTKNREGRGVLTPEMIKRAESKYVSFGGHTENHVYLTDIPLEQVEEEIVSNKQYLENILGHKVNDFCFPGGKYNQEILEIVYKHFKTARTADTMNFKHDGVIIKPTFHFYNRGKISLIGNAVRNHSFREMFMVLKLINRDYFSILEELLDCMKERDGFIVVWGHSWEIEEYGLWNNVEQLMQKVNRYGIGCSYEEIFKKDVK